MLEWEVLSSKSLVDKALFLWHAYRTTVYVSHRFSTTRRADKIAVVEEGTITELGSHDELMKLEGRYAEFFNLQAKAFVD